MLHSIRHAEQCYWAMLKPPLHLFNNSALPLQTYKANLKQSRKSSKLRLKKSHIYLGLPCSPPSPNMSNSNNSKCTLIFLRLGVREYTHDCYGRYSFKSPCMKLFLIVQRNRLIYIVPWKNSLPVPASAGKQFWVRTPSLFLQQNGIFERFLFYVYNF